MSLKPPQINCAKEINGMTPACRSYHYCRREWPYKVLLWAVTVSHLLLRETCNVKEMCTSYSGTTCDMTEICTRSLMNAALMGNKGKTSSMKLTEYIDYFCFPRMRMKLPGAQEVDECMYLGFKNIKTIVLQHMCIWCTHVTSISFNAYKTTTMTTNMWQLLPV